MGIYFLLPDTEVLTNLDRYHRIEDNGLNLSLDDIKCPIIDEVI